MQKPNAVLHMTGYGLVYGLLLGMLYIWGIFMLTSFGDGGLQLGDLFSMVMSTAYFAFIFGALPGAVMGFVEGWMLWLLTRNVQLPITEAEIAARRKVAFGVIGGLTFLGMGALLLLIFGSLLSMLIITPPFVAGAAAVYAVHRYFLKLRAWGSIGKAKNKAKHAPTNQLAYEDAADDDALLADESHQQFNDTRR
jgi:hypothetical protein